jgi:hypothetical protein
VDEWERKQHARIRRERLLEEGLDLRTRTVPSGRQFKRNLKHRPKDWQDWERLGDEPSD